MRFEHWIYSIPLRVRSLFRREQVEQELHEEIRDHLEQQIQANLAKGMSLEEARYSAMRALGGMTQIEEECREKRRVNHIEVFFQDLRYGLRQLRRSPGFSILAILCLTFGIGANAAVFSWVEGILFRPYPLVANQERLFAVAGTVQGKRIDGLSWPDFLDLRRGCTLCEDVFVTSITGSTLNIGDHAEVTTGSVVSANYIDSGAASNRARRSATIPIQSWSSAISCGAIASKVTRKSSGRHSA
jgi:hypothetical protein